MKARLPLVVAACLLSLSARAGEPEKSDSEKVAGTWRVTAATEAGQAMPESHVKLFQLVLTDRAFTAALGDYPFMKGTFTLDPAKTPRAIDLSSTSGQHAGKTLKGVYELTED